LPRIVTVHDVNIVPESKDAKERKMRMNATVKTYNEGVKEETTAVKTKRGKK
jgi:type IV pilus assembly protein PilO